MNEIRPKWTELDQSEQNWTELDQNGLYWTEWTAFQIGKLVLEASTKFLSAIGHMMFNLLELFFLKGEDQVYVA